MKFSAIFSYSSAVFAANSIPCRSKWRSRECRCLNGTVHRGFRRAHNDCTLRPQGFRAVVARYEPSTMPPLRSSPICDLYGILYHESVNRANQSISAHRVFNNLLVLSRLEQFESRPAHQITLFISVRLTRPAFPEEPDTRSSGKPYRRRTWAGTQNLDHLPCINVAGLSRLREPPAMLLGRGRPFCSASCVAHLKPGLGRMASGVRGSAAWKLRCRLRSLLSLRSSAVSGPPERRWSRDGKPRSPCARPSRRQRLYDRFAIVR